jgi:hypothetical protein
VSLEHDYPAWYAAMVSAKDAGHHRDWPQIVPRLRDYGPADLTVDDPDNICTLGLGHTVDSDPWGVWELDSPVSRPVLPTYVVVD